MARSDITAQVQRLIALGATKDQILSAGSRITNLGNSWYADNSASRTAIDMLEGEIKTAAAKKAAATEITSKIAAGKVLFTKDADKWLIWGREDVIVEGIGVTAERRDGSTQQVIITKVGPVLESGDLRYRVAEFRAPITAAPRLTNSAAAEADRIGRSYGVNGQIWDNA